MKTIYVLNAVLLSFDLIACGSNIGSQTSASTSAAMDETADNKSEDSNFREVLIDNDDVKAEIGMMDDAWNVTIENKTADNLQYTMSNWSVDEQLIFTPSPFRSDVWDQSAVMDLPANTGETSTLEFDEEEMKMNPYLKKSKYTFKLDVFTDTEDIASQYFDVYPEGKEAFHNDFITLFNNDSLSIYMAAAPENPGLKDSGILYAHLFLHNKTDQTLYFNVHDVLLDNTKCQPIWRVNQSPADETDSIKSVSVEYPQFGEYLLWQKSALETSGLMDSSGNWLQDVPATITMPLQVYDGNGNVYAEKAFTFDISNYSFSSGEGIISLVH